MNSETRNKSPLGIGALAERSQCTMGIDYPAIAMER